MSLPLDAEDLDETRRLAYMALLDVDHRDRSLGGTLVNALVHHQKAAGQEEAVAHVQSVLNSPRNEESRAWLKKHVERMTSELEK